MTQVASFLSLRLATLTQAERVVALWWWVFLLFFLIFFSNIFLNIFQNIYACIPHIFLLLCLAHSLTREQRKKKTKIYYSLSFFLLLATRCHWKEQSNLASFPLLVIMISSRLEYWRELPFCTQLNTNKLFLGLV